MTRIASRGNLQYKQRQANAADQNCRASAEHHSNTSHHRKSAWIPTNQDINILRFRLPDYKYCSGDNENSHGNNHGGGPWPRPKQCQAPSEATRVLAAMVCSASFYSSLKRMSSFFLSVVIRRIQYAKATACATTFKAESAFGGRWPVFSGLPPGCTLRTLKSECRERGTALLVHHTSYILCCSLQATLTLGDGGGGGDSKHRKPQCHMMTNHAA